MNVSVALKLTVARFINSSLILVFVNKEAKNWFESGNIAYEANILIFSLAFSPVIIYALNIPGWIRSLKRWLQKRKGDECKIT